MDLYASRYLIRPGVYLKVEEDEVNGEQHPPELEAEVTKKLAN